MYKKKYKYLQYKIDIIRIIMKNTFILYVFHIIRLYIFNNMFDQILSSLTLTKLKMQSKNGQYIVPQLIEFCCFQFKHKRAATCLFLLINLYFLCV
jgi:hypothetical protein